MNNTNLSNPTAPFFFNKKSFLHPLLKLELLETQVSWIIKTGSYCYKIKKNILIPGILDYKTIKKRQKHISVELKRNKIFAPQIYNKIVSLYIKNGITIFDSEVKNNREWVILMNQFNDDCVLDNKSLQKKLPLNSWKTMIKDLTYYHKKQSFLLAPGYFLWRYKLHLKEGINIHYLVKDIKNEFIKWHKKHKTDIYKRALSIPARQTHGDLHLKNLVWYKNFILPFDCLEFNDTLSIQDPLMDIAFLSMDLHFYNLDYIIPTIVSTYENCMEDYSWKKVLPPYLSLAALIRGIIVFQEGNKSHGKKYLQQSLLYLNTPLYKLIPL